MPCWGSLWPFRVCKCVLFCPQTSPGGTEDVWEKLIGISGCCIQNCKIIEVTCSFFPYIQFSKEFNHLSFPLYIPAASSPSFLLLCSAFPPQGKGYSILLFEVDICIIRLGCDCQWASPPEGAPEERGCCPAQQWRTPLLSHPPTSSAPASQHPPTRAAGRPRLQSFLRLAAAEGWESERKGEKGGGGSSVGRGWAEIFKHAECELALRG